MHLKKKKFFLKIFILTSTVAYRNTCNVLIMKSIYHAPCLKLYNARKHPLATITYIDASLYALSQSKLYSSAYPLKNN